jgi:hypothetical protein
MDQETILDSFDISGQKYCIIPAVGPKSGTTPTTPTTTPTKPKIDGYNKFFVLGFISFSILALIFILKRKR